MKEKDVWVEKNRGFKVSILSISKDSIKYLRPDGQSDEMHPTNFKRCFKKLK